MSEPARQHSLRMKRKLVSHCSELFKHYDSMCQVIREEHPAGDNTRQDSDEKAQPNNPTEAGLLGILSR